MKHSIFAPKELRDPSYIDSFRGIYMPYWAFYISQKGSLSLNGTKTSRRGDYIITDHYALTGDLDAYYKGLSYDASSSFDDNISEELAPYNLKGMKAFTPAYLSGFYADTSDVDAKVYQGDAEYTASAETTERIASDGTFAGFTMDTIRPEQLHTKTETIDSTMFPVWFLSYRKKDRVAYATVNGQTGLVVADIPIDPKRYLLGSLLLAIPIFALLAWSAILQPSSLVMTTLLLSLLAACVYFYECVSIRQKDTGANDRGKMFIQSKKASAADKPKTPEAQPEPAAKTNPLGWILPLCAAVLSFGVWFLHPVSDLYYYGAAILSMAAILVSFISIIHAYNLLSTRRLPQFDKQGGDDRA